MITVKDRDYLQATGWRLLPFTTPHKWRKVGTDLTLSAKEALAAQRSEDALKERGEKLAL